MCAGPDFAVTADLMSPMEAEAVSSAALCRAVLLPGAGPAEFALKGAAVGAPVCAWRIAALRVASLHSDMRAVDACICFRVKGSSAARTPVHDTS